MRRHRRKASQYHSYLGGSKKKINYRILFRVSFVIAVATLFFFSAVLLGRHLDKKSENSKSLSEAEESVTTNEEPETSVPEDYGIKSTSDASSVKVRSADISVSGSEEDIREMIDGMADTYNSVSVRITDGDRLVYSSPALLEYMKLPDCATVAEASTDDTDGGVSDSASETTVSTPLENIKYAVSYAKEKGLRAGALYTVTPDILNDTDDSRIYAKASSLLVGELSSFGFDEVIIGGLAEDGFSTEKAESIIRFISSLRESSASMAIGVTLPSSVYLDTPNAADIKLISEYADLLAITVSPDADSDDTAFNSVYTGYYSIKGTLASYNIRCIVSTEDKDVAREIASALNILSDGCSIQFSIYIDNPSYSASEDDVNGESSSETVSNPNALSSEHYEESSSAEEEP